MATLNMEGPFPLTVTSIDAHVPKGKIGNYGLGYTQGTDGSFIVKYIGRSDADLNARLKDHVGSYKEFKFSLAASAKEAYAKELRNYTDFGGNEALDNEIEPAKP